MFDSVVKTISLTQYLGDMHYGERTPEVEHKVEHDHPQVVVSPSHVRPENNPSLSTLIQTSNLKVTPLRNEQLKRTDWVIRPYRHFSFLTQCIYLFIYLIVV